MVQIKNQNKNVFLGYSDTKIGAAILRYNAEIKYDFISCNSFSYSKDYIDEFILKTNIKYEELEKLYPQHKRPRTGSGVAGVYKAYNKWQVKITLNNKSIYIGSFKTIEDASIAINNYKSKESV